MNPRRVYRVYRAFRDECLGFVGLRSFGFSRVLQLHGKGFFVDSGFRVQGTHRLLSSSFLGLPYRILNMNPKKELLRSLWVGYSFKCICGFAALNHKTFSSKPYTL